MSDPYLYGGTNVLRNHLGLRDEAELARVEARVTALALARLEVETLPGGYDLAHLQAFHRFIYGDLYPWAGQTRTVDLRKGGSRFCVPAYIDTSAQEIFGDLAARGALQGLSRPEFLDQAAHLWGEINALHPFREGNGRSTRAFLSQLARDAGHPVSWARLDQDELISASIRAQNVDAVGLRALLDKHTRVRPSPADTGPDDSPPGPG